jgi:hypothetical protein
MGGLQLVSQWRMWPEDGEFMWVSVICQAERRESKCNSMHILSSIALSIGGRGSETQVYLKGIAVCCDAHPTLGTEPQNIRTDGTYFVMPPVDAVRPNTWNRQFSTSAT